MQSKKSNIRWQVKLIFFVVLVVGLFFSWHGGRGYQQLVRADIESRCTIQSCDCKSISSCGATGCLWISGGCRNATVGLQAGSNKGAAQAGMSMAAGRRVLALQ
jgi:calponin family repeat protein